MSLFKNLFGSSDNEPSIWNDISEESELNELIEKSNSLPVLILKHSTRCSISSMAKNRLERDWARFDGKMTPYILNVVEQRELSMAVETKFNIQHESPQAIILKDGNVIYSDSHGNIQAINLQHAIE